jgi:hypothetical protein
VVNFRISRELKEKMDMLKHTNWSEVVRRAIEEVVNRYLARYSAKDFKMLRRSALRSEAISRRIDGWSSVEEIRRWRERR